MRIVFFFAYRPSLEASVCLGAARVARNHGCSVSIYSTCPLVLPVDPEFDSSVEAPSTTRIKQRVRGSDWVFFGNPPSRDFRNTVRHFAPRVKLGLLLYGGEVAVPRMSSKIWNAVVILSKDDNPPVLADRLVFVPPFVGSPSLISKDASQTAMIILGSCNDSINQQLASDLAFTVPGLTVLYNRRAVSSDLYRALRKAPLSGLERVGSGDLECLRDKVSRYPVAVFPGRPGGIYGTLAAALSSASSMVLPGDSAGVPYLAGLDIAVAQPEAELIEASVCLIQNQLRSAPRSNLSSRSYSLEVEFKEAWREVFDI